MATTIDYTTAKKHVISILQASRTAYSATTDGSKRQFASDDEIFNTILHIDGEVCSLICNTLQHPFQSTFIQTSNAITTIPAGNLPARNGMVIRVLCYDGLGTATITTVSTVDDTVELSSNYWGTGQKVQVSNSGGALPTGLSAATDYWLGTPDASESYVVKFYESPAILFGGGSAINLTGAGSGTNTVTPQYVNGIETDKDVILSANENPFIFTTWSYHALANYWAIEGDTIYSTSPSVKVVYTDYTKTSSPQAPEPYMWAVVAGAVSRLLKDGGDVETSAYYGNIYNQQLQEIASRATRVPAISQ